MPEFLAETYAPRGAGAPAAPGAAWAALAADQASQDGAPVRFLGAILMPEEETCLWLYQALGRRGPRGHDRRRAAARADHPRRLDPPPRSRPGTGSQPGRHIRT